jgi:hypothetical protein
MLAGVAMLILSARRTADPGWKGGQPIVVGALAIATTYLAGMIASVLVGSNQMVRNPRYLLPIVPFAALVAAYALARLPTMPGALREARREGRKLFVALEIDFRLSVAAGLVVLLYFVALAYGQAEATRIVWRDQLGSLRRAAFSSQKVLLSKFPFYRTQTYMREKLPPDAVVLALKPADMYYARHKMVSYLDARMIPAYLERDPARMAAMLRELGVTHVLRPHYSIPPVYNSALMYALADCRISRLLQYDRHYAVFALDVSESSCENRRRVATWDLTPGRYPWTGSSESTFPLLRQRCRVDDIPVNSTRPLPTVRACPYLPAHQAMYFSGEGPLYPRGEAPQAVLRAIPDATYLYSATLSGVGYFWVFLYERESGWNPSHLDDGVVSGPEKTFTRVFKLSSEVTHFRLAFIVQGAGELSIRNVKIEAFAPE